MSEWLLTDELRAWTGRKVRYTAPEELGRAAIRYFAQAIGDDNPLWTDEGYARAAGYPGVIAPPTLVCETSQYVAGRRPNREGYAGHTWDLPVSGCRLVRGGNEYELFRPVLPSDRITATWEIVGMDERVSSRGEPMLLVRSRASYTNQDGELLARNTETLIYQPLEDS